MKCSFFLLIFLSMACSGLHKIEETTVSVPGRDNFKEKTLKIKLNKIKFFMDYRSYGYGQKYDSRYFQNVRHVESIIDASVRKSLLFSGATLVDKHPDMELTVYIRDFSLCESFTMIPFITGIKHFRSNIVLNVTAEYKNKFYTARHTNKVSRNIFFVTPFINFCINCSIIQKNLNQSVKKLIESIFSVGKLASNEK